MSTIANWSYTEDLTVWPVTGVDQFNDPTFGAPYLLTGGWERGSDVARDAQGVEFVPNSVFYFELARDANPQPKIEDFIVLGDQTLEAAPTDDAERIRTVTTWGMELFGATELPDWKVMT